MRVVPTSTEASIDRRSARGEASSPPSAVIPLLLATVVALSCASVGRDEPQAGPAAGPGPTSEVSEGTRAEEAATSEAEASLVELRAENERLQQALDESLARRVELEERNAALETELANAVEEVLRAKAAVTGVQNRALAVSRISEVRVAVQALTGTTDAEVLRRINRATDLLRRADAALAEENYGGASFLAERASELVRQARTVADLRSSTVGADVLPIVPPRELEVTSTANLRAGPGVDTERIGSVGTGDHLRAIARAGQWFHVETESGLRAWIHASLVE